jgi:uncharacterized coiled-coil DUF342 family protein
MNSENSTTKPTLETILERIDSQGREFRQALAQLATEVGELRQGQTSLQSELHQFRAEQKELNEEILMRLRRIEKNVAGLSEVYWEARTDMRDLKRRIEKIEGEPAG